MAYKLRYENFWLLAAILDFLTPLVSGIMEDVIIELLDSENGKVALEMLFLSLAHPEIPCMGILLPPTLNYHLSMKKYNYHIGLGLKHSQSTLL